MFTPFPRVSPLPADSAYPDTQPSASLVDPSPAAGAPTTILYGQAHPRGIRTFDGGIGGKDHLASAGSIHSAEPVAQPRGPRGGPSERAPPGGAATISLGSGAGMYDCSVRESQERIAVDAAYRAATANAFTAGARPPPEELGVRRRAGVIVHPSVPVGGHSSLELTDGSGIGFYREGIKEAQSAAALSAAAMADAAQIPIAGNRVAVREFGSRHGQRAAIGGKTSVDLGWNVSAPHAGPPVEFDAPTSGRRGMPPSPSKVEVGANSARFLQPPDRAVGAPSSVGSLLGQGGAFAASPVRERLRADQPLGGRGLALVGAGALDAPRF